MKAKWHMGSKVYEGDISTDSRDVRLQYPHKPEQFTWAFYCESPTLEQFVINCANGLFESREAALADARAHGIEWEE